MTNTDTLLPCPFCGGSDAEYEYIYSDGCRHNQAFVCRKCGARAPGSGNITLAYEKWNTRSLAPADTLLVKEVVEVLESKKYGNTGSFRHREHDKAIDIAIAIIRAHQPAQPSAEVVETALRKAATEGGAYGQVNFTHRDMQGNLLPSKFSEKWIKGDPKKLALAAIAALQPAPKAEPSAEVVGQRSSNHFPSMPTYKRIQDSPAYKAGVASNQPAQPSAEVACDTAIAAYNNAADEQDARYCDAGLMEIAVKAALQSAKSEPSAEVVERVAQRLHHLDDTGFAWFERGASEDGKQIQEAYRDKARYVLAALQAVKGE